MAAVVAAAMLGTSRPGGGLLLVGVALVGVGIGTWRLQGTDPTGPSIHPSIAVLVDGDEHEVIGTVTDDPRPREDRIQLVLA